MGAIKTELLAKTKGLPPFEQVVAMYKDKSDFFKEMHNYLIGGLVISTPSHFVMAKPVDHTIEPEGQWYVEKPNAWYVKWFAGKGVIKAIMESVEPLPKIVFSRFKSGQSEIRKYDWKIFYNKTKD